MIFLDRKRELSRLQALLSGSATPFAVVYGRRRVGKTRLLLEWTRKSKGVYALADQSTPEVQRHYLAQAIGQHLPGFASVRYPDWATMLSQASKMAKRETHKRRPLVLDEFPYLVANSPELPSILQRWIDLELSASPFALAIAGSSQRMMQGFVLDRSSPLFGRASEVIDTKPLAPYYLSLALGARAARQLIDHYAAWGGIPRYWELAADLRGSVQDRIDRLVLDPLGPLHEEPTRLLLQELPPAAEARPVLDAIGLGAHRLSEIAGRIGRPATALAGALGRLIEMGLVRREVPFGQPEKRSKRSLYVIEDPFTRLWFRVVAANRGLLASAPAAARRALLDRHWPQLVARSWEDLARMQLPHIPGDCPLGKLGPWTPAKRWWQGNRPEWDIVAENLSGERLLVGEVKWHDKPWSLARIRAALAELQRKDLPKLGAPFEGRELVLCLFVPQKTASVPDRVDGVWIVTGADLILHASDVEG